MSSTEARATGGETTDTTETREVASSAAERLGGPLDDERTRGTASEAETDVGRRAETTVGEGERSTNTASAESYNSRWTELKGEFVDDPRSAVRGANELVGEVLDELEELFRRQRTDLEHGLDSEQTTTEDLRHALRRYRSLLIACSRSERCELTRSGPARLAFIPLAHGSRSARRLLRRGWRSLTGRSAPGQAALEQAQAPAASWAFTSRALLSIMYRFLTCPTLCRISPSCEAGHVYPLAV